MRSTVPDGLNSVDRWIGRLAAVLAPAWLVVGIDRFVQRLDPRLTDGAFAILVICSATQLVLYVIARRRQVQQP